MEKDLITPNFIEKEKGNKDTLYYIMIDGDIMFTLFPTHRSNKFRKAYKICFQI